MGVPLSRGPAAGALRRRPRRGQMGQPRKGWARGEKKKKKKGKGPPFQAGLDREAPLALPAAPPRVSSWGELRASLTALPSPSAERGGEVHPKNPGTGNSAGCVCVCMGGGGLWESRKSLPCAPPLLSAPPSRVLLPALKWDWSQRRGGRVGRSVGIRGPSLWLLF